MSWAYEIVLRGSLEQSAGLPMWLETGTHDTCAGVPGLASIDLYTPADGPTFDPCNDDGAGPLMMLVLDFASRDTLAAAVASGRIVAVAGALAPDIAVTETALERRFYPVGEDETPALLQAPFSYVVRYHRPADDETALVKAYLATHPATEARLPRIRSIMCYLPVEEVHASHLQGARADVPGNRPRAKTKDLPVKPSRDGYSTSDRPCAARWSGPIQLLCRLEKPKKSQSSQ
jgi:hypothetical protein